MITPYGGRLIPLLAEGAERLYYLEEAQGLNQLKLNTREYSDLIMLATGSYSPLKGFVGKGDYERIITEMRMESGLMWPIPITLSVSEQQAKKIKVGERLALKDPTGNETVGILTVEEKFRADKDKEVKGVFGTTDLQHPGVREVYRQGEIYLGGPVLALSEGDFPAQFSEFARPSETRKIFLNKGWSSVVAFQTRNPIHRSHEYLTKIALEFYDGLFINPVVGKLKEGDIPAEVRLECYRTLINNYYPEDRVVLKVYPLEMRYAGPREAVLHAVIRQNFGCTHFIVGRDHAGVGTYYGSFDAQAIFDRLKPDDLQIEPLKMDWTFWCHKCACMASPRTCPHDKKHHLMIAGTELREMLAEGKIPPAEFSRPEVTQILVDYYTAGAGN